MTRLPARSRAARFGEGRSLADTSPASLARMTCELLLELGEDLRPLAGAELVGDDLVVLDHEEPRRAALAGQLIEDRLEIAGPVALLVGLLELGRVDLDPGDLLVLRRSEPAGLVLVLPGRARLAVPAADIDHLEDRLRPRRQLKRAADQRRDDEDPPVHAGSHLVDDSVDQVLLVEPHEVDAARRARRLEVGDGALRGAPPGRAAASRLPPRSPARSGRPGPAAGGRGEAGRPMPRSRSWNSRRRSGGRPAARSADRRRAPGSRPGRCRRR